MNTYWHRIWTMFACNFDSMHISMKIYKERVYTSLCVETCIRTEDCEVNMQNEVISKKMHSLRSTHIDKCVFIIIHCHKSIPIILVQVCLSLCIYWYRQTIIYIGRAKIWIDINTHLLSLYLGSINNNRLNKVHDWNNFIS